MRRSTSGDILDQFEGDLKFCTGWLHLSPGRAYLYRNKAGAGYLFGCVGCTDLIMEQFLVPGKVDRIAFVFTMERSDGDASTRVREGDFLDFAQAAREEAGIAEGTDDRWWSWHVILDWED